MSKVKDIEGNIELKRRLIFIDGMANTLLNQMKDIKSEADSLKKYSEEDINFYKDKITEIDNKICNEYIGSFDISKWRVIGNIYENKELFLNI